MDILNERPKIRSPSFVAGFVDEVVCSLHILGRKVCGVAACTFLELQVKGSVFLVIAIGAGDDSDWPELPVGGGLAKDRMCVDGIAVGEGSLVSEDLHYILRI